MICPHCNKETDSYGTNAEDVITMGSVAAGGVLNYTYTLNNAAAANPVVVAPAGTSILLDVTGCANQGILNIHYHTF